MTKTSSLSQSPVVICALYKFTCLIDFKALQSPLLQLMKAHHVRGTLLLASEGINGTISGSGEAINIVINELNKDNRLNPLECKISLHYSSPFKRTRVKLKKEIVTMGVEGVDPKRVTGTYIEPKNWDQLIEDPDVLLIDTRNEYEVQVGTFKNAISPNTKIFREFPDYVKQNLSPDKHKKIAMFCTGGIRCEKSTAYLKEQGFNEVYHLKGGILKYLEEIPESDSSWEGECFVFDDRVTVNHRLKKGSYDQCHACRLPITSEDKDSEFYRKGVSCPHCFNAHTEQQKTRFMEREKQMKLAKQRGETHLGGAVSDTVTRRRAAKQLRKTCLKSREV